MAKKSFQIDTEEDVAQDSSNVVAFSRTLIEKTYNKLRTDIVEGKLSPNEKLRIEHLKNNYQVGAGTLREATSRLISDGLVVAEGQRGFRVSPMAIKDLEDITTLRIQLEIPALRRAIQNSDQTWRDTLTAVFEELDALGNPGHVSDRKQWEQLNARFHTVMIEEHASPWTLRFLDMLSRHGERYRRLSTGLQSPGRDVQAEHRDIYLSAMDKNDVRASLALEAHISMTANLIKQAASKGINIF